MANVDFIFLMPPHAHGEISFLFASRRNRFSIRLAAKSIFYMPHGECRFIFLLPPHGEIDFLFASRRMLILFFSRPLTAKSIFYSPHGECRFFFSRPSRRNRFSIRLRANSDFLFASRRMLILFFLRPLTARLGFIPIRA